jgi:predicted transcriptional regulator
MADTRVLTAHVPVELAETLDEYSARLERPRSWIVKQALRDWVERENERMRLTLEGLADIDAGRVVDDETVKTWIESLDTEDPLPLPR